MDIQSIKGRIAFLQEAKRLKSVLRSAHTSTGRAESTAEHTWRLCLMAMAFESELSGLDMLKILKMCIVHDLGEAIHGDIPAIEKSQHPDKSAQEMADLLHLTRSLGEVDRSSILALWQEYEDAASPEAKAAAVAAWWPRPCWRLASASAARLLGPTLGELGRVLVGIPV